MTETHLQSPLLGMEVPIGSIESELKRLWEADQASTNASLMNLAVYSEDPRSLERNSKATQALTREHACRAILIGMDRQAPEVGIRAWITAHCHLAHGRKSVCCEQLSFLLQGKAVGRMRNTVFAHLASDLPLVFWWQGELSDLFEPSLYGRIDRLVFDSDEWRDPSQGFERVCEAADGMQRRLVLHDLAWTRSYHFRLAIAGLFDDPLALRALPEVSEVRLAAHPEHRAAAFLLLAWLVTQAGWRPGLELGTAASRAGGCGECFGLEARGGRNVTVTIEWEAEGPPLGRLEVHGPGCRVEVSRTRGARHLQQRLIAAKHRLDLSGPADADDPVALVGDQLSRGGENSLFRKVLPTVAKLLAMSR